MKLVLRHPGGRSVLEVPAGTDSLEQIRALVLANIGGAGDPEALTLLTGFPPRPVTVLEQLADGEAVTVKVEPSAAGAPASQPASQPVPVKVKPSAAGAPASRSASQLANNQSKSTGIRTISDLKSSSKPAASGLSSAALAQGVMPLKPRNAGAQAPSSSRVTTSWPSTRQDQLCLLSSQANLDEVQKLLFEVDAEQVNGVDRRGWRPLLHAVNAGSVDVCKCLLDAGANPAAPDKDNSTAIHKAAANHADILLMLIHHLGQAAAAHINAVDKRSFSPLHIAASSGCSESVKILVAAGASCDARDGRQRTPLHLACCGVLEGHLLAVQTLIANKATVNVCDKSKTSPLLFAAKAKNLSVCKCLLDAGAIPCAVNSSGRSALHEACDCPDVVCAVIEHAHKTLQDTSLVSEFVRKPSSSKCTALFEACSAGNTSSIEALVNCVGASSPLSVSGAQGPHSMTLLHVAAQAGHAEAVGLLIKLASAVHRGDIISELEARDESLRTPLHLASIEGHVECVELLLSAGGSVQSADSVGNTSWHFAANRGHSVVISALLRNSAEGIDTTNHCQETPLLLAATQGHLSPVQLLISANACYTTTPSDKTSPFIEAVRFNHVEVVQYLLTSSMADSCCVTTMHGGLGPMHIAALHGGVSCLAALRDHGRNLQSQLANKEADINMALTLSSLAIDVEADESQAGATPLLLTAWHGQIQAFNFLQGEDANLDFKDEKNQNLFHHAANSGTFPNPVLEKMLLIHPEAAQEADFMGNTPFLCCCCKGLDEFAGYFLKVAPDTNVDAANDEGYTSLHYAALGGMDTLADMLLSKHHAEPNVQNKAGATPLILACTSGFTALAAQLITLGCAVDEVGCSGRTPLMEVVCMEEAVGMTGAHQRQRERKTIVPEEKRLMVAMLLNQSASVQHCDHSGQNAVHLLASGQTASVIKANCVTLQQFPRNATQSACRIKDNAGRTPMDIANNGTSKDILILLGALTGTLEYG